MKNRSSRLIVLIFFFCMLMSLNAQKDEKKTISVSKTWFSAGVGLGNIGPSIGLSLNHLHNDRLFKVRFVREEEFVLNLFGSSPPPESVWDIGLLYGFCRTKGKSSIMFSSGVSYVEGMRLGDDDTNYKEISISTIGLPVEAQFMWPFSKCMGLGVTLFGNINSESIFGGITLNLIFGKLR